MTDDQWLRTTVFTALDNAVANGYEVGGPAEEAVELADLDADLEGIPAAAIAPYVAAWRDRDGAP